MCLEMELGLGFGGHSENVNEVQFSTANFFLRPFTFKSTGKASFKLDFKNSSAEISTFC